MRVYHGSTVIVDAPLVGAGRRNLDFGLGFYVTDLEQQAVSWATRPFNSGRPGILNQEIVDNHLQFIDSVHIGKEEQHG